MPKVPEYNLPEFPPMPKRGGSKRKGQIRAYWKPVDHKRSIKARKLKPKSTD